VFEPIPKYQLIDENGAQGEATNIVLAFGRDLPMAIKDTLKLFIEGNCSAV